MTAAPAVPSTIRSTATPDAKTLFAHSEGMIDVEAAAVPPAATSENAPVQPGRAPAPRRLIIVDENWW